MSAPPLNLAQFYAFRELVHDLTGVVVPDSKRGMLEHRISRRMLASGNCSASHYYKQVLDNRDERVAFIDQVTTHETRFFRTPRIWEYLQQQFLPSWTDRHEDKECRVWSAATSSGEEAYSLSILMREYRRRVPSYGYRIHGTDVSELMIQRCRAAVYGKRSVAHFAEAKPAQFKRYLRAEGDGYAVRSPALQRVWFACENLFDTNAPEATYDLVLLRNVLIYFSQGDQVRALESVHRRMNEGAILIVGESECLTGLRSLFENIAPLVYRAIHVNRTRAAI